MKTLLKLGNITVGEISISDITIEQEYTATDVVELAYHGKSFVKELIKELPEIMEDLYTAFDKFNELDEKAEDEIGWEITSVTVSKVEESDFDYCFSNNISSIRKEIEKKNFSFAKEGIVATHAMCEKAFHDDEIDIKIFVSCINELNELLMKIETMKCSF